MLTMTPPPSPSGRPRATLARRRRASRVLAMASWVRKGAVPYLYCVHANANLEPRSWTLDSDDGEFAMDSAAIGAELSKASASARWAGTLMRRTRASALQRRQRPRATRSTRS